MSLSGRMTVAMAVQLNGKTGFFTEKIQFIWAERMPAAEFVSAKSPVA